MRQPVIKEGENGMMSRYALNEQGCWARWSTATATTATSTPMVLLRHIQPEHNERINFRCEALVESNMDGSYNDA